MHLAFSLLLYIASGVLQPTLVDWIKYHGGGGTSSPPQFLPMLANTLGMASVLLMECWWGGRSFSSSSSSSFSSASLGVHNLVNERFDLGVVSSSSVSPSSSTSSLLYLSSSFIKSIRHSFSRYSPYLLATAIDFLSGAFIIVGLLRVGSGVFVVIYSSCTFFTAVFGRIFLKTPLSALQWLGITLVCVGLVLSGFANSRSSSTSSTSSSTTTTTTTTSDLLGIGFILVGSVAHSAMFVVLEILLPSSSSSFSATSSSTLSRGTSSLPLVSLSSTYSSFSSAYVSPPPLHLSPLQVCSFMGSVEAVLLIIWNVILYLYYGISPMTNTLLASTSTATAADEREEEKHRRQLVLFCYLLLAFVNALHAGAFFALISKTGAVASSLCKGLQAVAVFLFSATFFCSYQASQCFTWLKALALVVVCAGMLLYGVGRKNGPGSSDVFQYCSCFRKLRGKRHQSDPTRDALLPSNKQQEDDDDRHQEARLLNTSL